MSCEDLQLVPMDEGGLRTLEQWGADPELHRRYSAPTAAWFRYVSTAPGVYAWMIYEGDSCVAHIQIDVDAGDGTGYPGLVVNPELRGQGYGRRALRAALARPELAGCRRFVAGVEADNLAARRCVEAVGFALAGASPDADGFLTYVYLPGSR